MSLHVPQRLVSLISTDMRTRPSPCCLQVLFILAPLYSLYSLLFTLALTNQKNFPPVFIEVPDFSLSGCRQQNTDGSATENKKRKEKFKEFKVRDGGQTTECLRQIKQIKQKLK